MGDRSMAQACADGDIELSGDPRVASRFPEWLGHHPVLGKVAPAAPA